MNNCVVQVKTILLQRKKGDVKRIERREKKRLLSQLTFS